MVLKKLKFLFLPSIVFVLLQLFVIYFTRNITKIKENIEKGDKHESNARFRPDDKMLFIDEFDKAKEVKSVDVLLIVLTYHKYFHRRENIRKTWIDTCHNHKKVLTTILTSTFLIVCLAMILSFKFGMAREAS